MLKCNIKYRLQYSLQSVYFTENSCYRSLKNRNCVTVFGSCSATLTVGKPLGDVYRFANHDFRTSVTGISGEIATSYFLFFKLSSRSIISLLFGELSNIDYFFTFLGINSQPWRHLNQRRFDYNNSSNYNCEPV